MALMPKNSKGKYQAGYTATTRYELTEREVLPLFNSAQSAELYVLT